MNDSRERVGDVVVLRHPAALDGEGAGSPARALLAGIGRGARVVIDLSGAGRLDRAACLALVSSSRRADPEGDGAGRVVVCGPTNEARALLELLRIDRALDVYGTKRDAPRSFTHP